MIKQIETTAEKDEALLICQSKGYPDTSVTWLDGQQRELNSSLTVKITPDRLFIVTSEIRVRSSVKNNYTCRFTTDGSSATFHIPGKPSLSNCFELYCVMSSTSFLVSSLLPRKLTKSETPT